MCEYCIRNSVWAKLFGAFNPWHLTLGISYQRMSISIMHFISQYLYCILLTTCIVCLYNFSQLHLSCSTYTALCTLHSPSPIPSYVAINIPFIKSKHTYPTVSLCISNLILYPNG